MSDGRNRIDDPKRTQGIRGCRRSIWSRTHCGLMPRRLASWVTVSRFSRRETDGNGRAGLIGPSRVDIGSPPQVSASRHGFHPCIALPASNILESRLGPAPGPNLSSFEHKYQKRWNLDSEIHENEDVRVVILSLNFSFCTGRASETSASTRLPSARFPQEPNMVG